MNHQASLLISLLITISSAIKCAQRSPTKKQKLNNKIASNEHLVIQVQACLKALQPCPLGKQMARNILTKIDAALNGSVLDGALQLQLLDAQDDLKLKFFNGWTYQARLECLHENTALAFCDQGGRQFPFLLKVKQPNKYRAPTDQEIARQWKQYVPMHLMNAQELYSDLLNGVPIKPLEIEQTVADLEMIYYSAHSSEADIKTKAQKIKELILQKTKIKQWKPDSDLAYCKNWGLLDEEKAE